MKTNQSFSIKDLAQKIHAKVVGDESRIIARLAPISSAQVGDLTFCLGGIYRRYLSETKASAVILRESDVAPSSATLLIVQNPELAFANIAKLFDSFQKPKSGIHPSAVIAVTAVIPASASIGAHVVIGENVKIGENTAILANCVIGDSVEIGANCILHANVTIYHHTHIHQHVILHSGVVIGADGFGLTRDGDRFEKIPQLGSVVIEDDVEIGANSCIDRGALENTILKKSVKIDNLVQIAHNVIVGENTVIAGCCGIAGSTTIGKNCLIGGATNIGDHLQIVDGVIFTGNAMVTKSVHEPGIYSSGTGLMPNHVWRKNIAVLRRLSRMKTEETL